jgi:hypothetical protein
MADSSVVLCPDVVLIIFKFMQGQLRADWHRWIYDDCEKVADWSRLKIVNSWRQADEVCKLWREKAVCT